MNSTPPRILYIVVSTIGLLAVICVTSLCASLFVHVYADAVITTALITITGGLIGSLGTLLSSTKTQPPIGDTTTSTTITTTPKVDPPVPTQPQEVIVTNPPEDPAHVTTN